MVALTGRLRMMSRHTSDTLRNAVESSVLDGRCCLTITIISRRWFSANSLCLRPTRFDIRSRGLCCIFVIYCKSAFDIAHCLYCRSILCCYGLAAIGDCVTDQRLGRLVAIDVLSLIRPLNGDGIVTLSKFNYQIGCSNSSVVLSYSR